MATKTRRILPSEAAAALGSISTPKKAASSAANGIKTRFKAKPLEAFQCTCGKCPDNPKTYCPRGRAIIRRRGQASAQVASALTLRDELAATIQAGTRRDVVPFDAAAELAELREERFANAS